MTAATACRTCGTEPREGARFCDACGSLIAPAAEHAEYKQVTVLFADVVHSVDVGPSRKSSRTPPNGWTGFNHRRLYEYCGDVPPADMEVAYYAQHRRPAAG
jgi:hypothetical protein